MQLRQGRRQYNCHLNFREVLTISELRERSNQTDKLEKIEEIVKKVFLKFVNGMKKRASATENTEFIEILKGFSQSSLRAQWQRKS